MTEERISRIYSYLWNEFKRDLIYARNTGTPHGESLHLERNVIADNENVVKEVFKRLERDGGDCVFSKLREQTSRTGIIRTYNVRCTFDRNAMA